MDFSELFHQSSKRSGAGGPQMPKSPKDWPEDWLTVDFKTYPRLPFVELPEGKLPAADLFSAIGKRESMRAPSGKPPALEQLSALLAYSCGITDTTHAPALHRAQPSAGGRYPLEVYPFVFKKGGVPPGIYHYNVKRHGLEVLEERSWGAEDMERLFTYEWARGASVALVITALFGRTQMKYGERGYRYVFLEAGHIGQNVYLVAQALGLHPCAIVGTHDETLEKLLDIDGISESVVYTLTLS